ncbi:MAG: MCE family protein, partial [Deltaproteobacteria bacterium]|nr:MCE family protein [Deltaproteobacteria bacterium]
MDKKIANNITLGIFVAIAFIGFVFMLFNIGGGRGILSSQYKLFAKFTDVKGLHYGSEVSLAGLRIGVVKNIAVSEGPDKLLIVELSISKSVQERIRGDSTAILRTQGVLGDKYIEIYIGSPQHPVLNDGDNIRTSEASDLFTKSGHLVEDISKEFQKGGKVDTLIGNLNQLASNLAQLTVDIKKEKGLLHELIYSGSGEKLNRSLTHLEGILKKVNGGEGTLGALIN